MAHRPIFPCLFCVYPHSPAIQAGYAFNYVGVLLFLSHHHTHCKRKEGSFEIVTYLTYSLLFPSYKAIPASRIITMSQAHFL